MGGLNFARIGLGSALRIRKRAICLAIGPSTTISDFGPNT